MMLRILHQESGKNDDALLEAAFEMRAKVMYEQLNWRFVGQNTDRDEDHFDTKHTLHFISSTEDGTVVAYGRLNPTMAPHMFSDLFPEHCHFGGVVRKPSVYEHSRYLVDKTVVDKTQWRKHRGSVEIGIAKLCASAGLEGITWLSSLDAYAHVAGITQGTRPLGLPVYSEPDDQSYVAAFSASTPAMIPMMGQYYGFGDERMLDFDEEVRAVTPSVMRSVAQYSQYQAA